MMSPRSLLFSRQNQNLRAPVSSSISVSPGYPQLFSPPDSPHSSPPQNGKYGRDFSFSYGSRSSAATATTTKMAVTSRRNVKSGHATPTPSPPRSTTTTSARPTTPTSPVQIPTKSKRDAANPPKQRNHRYHEQRRQRSSSPRWGELHSSDAVPPSVAALLAVTAIPPPRNQRPQRQRVGKDREKRMTIESILDQESEKELSLNFIKGPLDVLLSPPEDLEDDDLSIGESTIASPLSTRTVSYESVQSMPSLTDSFSTDTLSSVGTPQSPVRGRRMQPTRRSLTPVSSPPGTREEHPLSFHEESEELDFSVFDASPETEEKRGGMRLALRPFRSAFKSNLTSSLRALRNAARSFSNMNMPSIPPEDFLTRSILTMEPNVPFTDERMPPTLDEEPSAAVRRYLNPTQTSRLESQASSSAQNTRSTFTASIQMQTYKVHRSRSAPAGSRGQNAVPRSPTGGQPTRGKEAGLSFSPGPRQREMRENSDFIRIAVMEMAMRRSGKLDEQRPGRARWALPPRKTSTKAYETGADGVPTRWVSVTY